MRSASISSPLLRLLVNPSKISKNLDWYKKSGGNVLTLNVLWDRLDLAVASNPALDRHCQPLPSIPIETTTVLDHNRRSHKSISSSVTRELQSILTQYQKVCGILVHWPLQPEGWCGAHCGRVLFTLDEMLSQSSWTQTQSPPISLWHDTSRNTSSSQVHADAWGRSRPCRDTKIWNSSGDNNTQKLTIHVASQEQYYLSEDTIPSPTEVWDNFCRVHWPEVFQSNKLLVSDLADRPFQAPQNHKLSPHPTSQP